MRNNKQTENKYIRLNKKNCKACWKCIESCANNVIGKIDIMFHKHTRINKNSDCIGCLKCVMTCENNAITSKNQKLAD